MKKLMNWIYKFDSYNLWFYRGDFVSFTYDYYKFGRKRQKEIYDEDLIHEAMLASNVIKHYDCK